MFNVQRSDGEIGTGYIMEKSLLGVESSIESFITSVNTMSAFYVRKGCFVEGFVFDITKELNDQLMDIPENEGNWAKIYSGVPKFFMERTARVVEKDADGNEVGWQMYVFNDLKCDEANELAKRMIPDEIMKE